MTKALSKEIMTRIRVLSFNKFLKDSSDEKKNKYSK